MWGPSTESQARRREFGFGCLAFGVGFVSVAMAFVYIYVRYGTQEDRWWHLAELIRMLLEFPLLGGLGLGGGTFFFLNWWHHRLGIYHCSRCGRSLPFRGYCVCLPEGFHRVRRRPSKWRHYRPRIVRVLVLYAAFVPIAYALAVWVKHPYQTFPVAFVGAHWAICMALFVVLELFANFAEMFGRGKRFRKRWVVSKPVFGAYPVVLALTVAIVEIIKTASP